MKKSVMTKTKVATLLYNVFLKCDTKTPFVLSNLVSEINLTSNAPTIIKKLNIIERVEKTTGGYIYRWNAEGPNDELFNRVTAALQEYTKNVCKPKPKAQQVAAEIVAPETVEVVIVPAKPETGLLEIATPELPAPPANMPGPLQAVYNMIADNARQQTAYLRVMGAAMEDIRKKIDYLFNTLKN